MEAKSKVMTIMKKAMSPTAALLARSVSRTNDVPSVYLPNLKIRMTRYG